ncbi:hypothetical protein CTA1_10049 [Colletotrichum tanaceti]|uniref:Uncharacterized protein n=1 Tax=Colletotrichum tanaceti TaxID=1306861 RepID=A0A4U6XVR9_9PEZI|nr:hypothetical protein CTA1_10049 [Colletotrichum tanaceti]
MKAFFFQSVLVVGVLVHATVGLTVPELDGDIQNLQERSNPKLKLRDNTQTLDLSKIPNNGGPPLNLAGLGPQVVPGVKLDSKTFGGGGKSGVDVNGLHVRNPKRNKANRGRQGAAQNGRNGRNGRNGNNNNNRGGNRGGGPPPA